MANSVRVALIGLGGYGATHLRALQVLQKEEQARLVAVAEVNQERLADKISALRSAGVAIYADWQDMLSAGGFDMVAVAAPLHLHRIMVVTALEAGYPVLCEKSAGVTVQDVAAMDQAARQTGLPCGIDFQWLTSPILAKLKSMVAEGQIGELRRVSGVGLWKRPDSYYERAAWAGRFRIGDAYVFDGPMFNALAHMLNNCLYLASPEPGQLLSMQQVRGEMYRAIPLPEMEDTATLYAKAANGVEVIYIATYCNKEQLAHYYRIEGSKGAIIMRDRQVYLQKGKEEQHLFAVTDEGDTLYIYRNFLAALANQEPLVSPISESVKLVKVQNCAYRSSGRIHPVNAPLSHRYEEQGSMATEICDIAAYSQQCVEQGALFSDCGAPWAVATPWCEVGSFTNYAPLSPDQLS